MEKEPIKFILTDDSLNSYGFRVLTAGINLKSYKANPILLYGHIRSGSYKKPDSLPIGKLLNIKLEDGKLTAEAEFDQEDEFAVKIENKLRKGYLNAVSIGFDNVEYSEDPALMAKGQKYPTVTKSTLREVSIVDVPSNSNAIRLKSNSGAEVMLSEDGENNLDEIFKTQNKLKANMKSIIAAIMSIQLNGKPIVTLADDAGEKDVENAVFKLQQKFIAIEKDAKESQEKVTNLETELSQLKEDTKKTKAENLVQSAIDSKKIVESEKDGYTKLALADYDATKEILDKKKAAESISQQLNLQENDGKSPKMTWDEADKAGKLQSIKENNLEEYKRMFKEKFDKEPTNV